MVYIWIYVYISLYINMWGFGYIDGLYIDEWIDLMDWIDEFG